MNKYLSPKWKIVNASMFSPSANCEILVLDDFDFKALLKPYVKKVWIEKKKAIASLSYLKFMNDSQVSPKGYTSIYPIIHR